MHKLWKNFTVFILIISAGKVIGKNSKLFANSVQRKLSTNGDSRHDLTFELK